MYAPEPRSKARPIASLAGNLKALYGECPECGLKMSRPKGMYTHLGRKHDLRIDWNVVAHFNLRERIF